MKGVQELDVTINTISDVRQEADIHLSNDELQPHFDKAYQKYQPKLEMKGFRKGKVPMEIVKRIYGDAIEHEALDDVASEVYREAMSERQIKPLGTPSMINADFKRGDHFHFKIQYDVKPVITLGRYKGVKVDKRTRRISDEEVEARLHLIRQANGTTEDVTTVTGTEHTIIGDAQELDDSGAPIVGKRTADARFYLGDTSLVKEIRDSLSNASVGETYKVQFESRHGDHSHKITLAIKVKKIEKMNLPPLDAEFVKKVTGDKMSTPEELTKNIRQDLERRNQDQEEREVEDTIAHELVSMHDFPVPESMVNTFLDAFVDDIKGKSRDRKLPRDFDEEKFRQENREGALWQAKWILLKERIAEVEGIQVTEAELEALADVESTRTGVDKARLLEYFKSSSSGHEQLLTNKLMAFLKSQAQIIEKVAEDSASPLQQQKG